jgi:hypothetical protein
MKAKAHVLLAVTSIICTVLCGTAFSEDKTADSPTAAPVEGLGTETRLYSTSLVCAGTNVTVDVFRSIDLDMFQARKVVIRTRTEWGDENVLTLVAGSFGVECRDNAQDWQGYVVFQTACPESDPHEGSPPRCDFKNYFGIIRGPYVLIVPDEGNGRLAARIFNYPSKKKLPMKPVKTLFNMRKVPLRKGYNDSPAAIIETYTKEIEKALPEPKEKTDLEPSHKE